MIESQLAPVSRERVTAEPTSILKQQLVREITCLERQLERVKEKEHYLDTDHLDIDTLETYQEMIDARRRMLLNLPMDDDYESNTY